MRLKAIILFLFCFHASFSEDTLRLSLQYCIQRTFIHNSFESGNRDLTGISDGAVKTLKKYPSYNQGGGLLLKRRLRNRFWVCYGAQYIAMEQSYELIRSDGVSFPGKIRLRYVGFPLLLQVDFCKRKKTTFYISGGPQVSSLVFETGAIPLYNGVLGLIDAGSAYKNFSLDFVSLTGAAFQISPKYQFEILARFIYGVTNPEDKEFRHLNKMISEELFVAPDGTKRPATHALAIGALIAITRKLR